MLFRSKAQSEFSFFNSFRALAKFLPYYKKSYQKASLVLAGSKDTYRFLAKSIPLNERRLRLYHENGVDDSFFQSKTKKKDKKTLSLLFIGRLVPYKCCDILIRAIHAVPKDIKPVIECTIVGDGSEKNRLKRLIKTCRLENQITMTGWVDQNETRQFYSQADLFCFPSIREFGGAVVLEAQAHGLPCLVTNHGGISEYVEDQKTGYKINASSYQDMVNGFSKKITELFYDREKLSYLSRQAHDHAKQWEWSEKAQQLYKIYHQCIQGQYDE